MQLLYFVCNLRSKLSSRNVQNVIWLMAICLFVGSLFYAVDTHGRMKRFEVAMSSAKITFQRYTYAADKRVKRDLEELKNSLETSVVKRNAPKESAVEDEYSIEIDGGGATYIRWGRSECPGNTLTKMIYSGVAAGTYYTHGGGGSNYICIDANITYEAGKYYENNQGSSHIYGVEFRDSAWMYNMFNLSLTENNALQFHSLPCALCMAEYMITQVMIPGREVCPKGWQMEYRGFIMAGGHGDTHTSNFVCVDETPEVVPGTSANDKGSFIFMVESQCNSLLCEPFVANRELRCVVCTL